MTSLAGICALAALVLRGESMKALRKGFAIQSAALVVLAVPVALSGMWICVGWSILAIAFAARVAACQKKTDHNPC